MSNCRTKPAKRRRSRAKWCFTAIPRKCTLGVILHVTDDVVLETVASQARPRGKRSRSRRPPRTGVRGYQQRSDRQKVRPRPARHISCSKWHGKAVTTEVSGGTCSHGCNYFPRIQTALELGQRQQGNRVFRDPPDGYPQTPKAGSSPRQTPSHRTYQDYRGQQRWLRPDPGLLHRPDRQHRWIQRAFQESQQLRKGRVHDKERQIGPQGLHSARNRRKTPAAWNAASSSTTRATRCRSQFRFQRISEVKPRRSSTTPTTRRFRRHSSRSTWPRTKAAA